MADEKPAAKPESKSWSPATAGQIFSELAAIFFVIIIIGSLLGYFSGVADYFSQNSGISIPWYERFTETGRLLSHSKPLSSIENPIGMRVISSKNNDVYDTPGGKKIGSHKLGDAGRIIQGPVEIDGVKYWYVDYDTDPDGWVKEDDVRSLTTPISTLAEPIGSTVMNTTDAPVYDQNGNKIGSHKAGDKGKITKGPIYINGEKYWYVDYENGTDGWVRESDIGATDPDNFIDKFVPGFFRIFNYFRYFIYLISILFILGIIYLWNQIDKIRLNETKLIYPEVTPEATKINPKWERILDLSESLNENDWRQAIIEADIMLAELLDKMQLPGESIGDKLKLIEKSDFNMIDNAWEAHKIRNNIAHEGLDYVLTQRETRWVIGLYKTVFEEFQMI